MSSIGSLRRRLALRHRFRDSVAVKHDSELRWWLEQWDPVFKAGGLNPPDALTFLEDEHIEGTYVGRRWQQARAEVRRVLQEAEIADESFFDGKVVVDVGSGPIGFPDACPARVSIGVDPLAARFASHGLLLPESRAVYLATGIEAVPLVAGTVDVVVARNSLDHVDEPADALGVITRLLRPRGTLILGFDVDHSPTVTEPHPLTVEMVRSLLTDLTVLRERHWDRPFGPDGHRVMLVGEKR
jgi:SAM-dependent methyltransferase